MMCQLQPEKMTMCRMISGTCMYPLTKFLDFKQIDQSGFSLLLNTHFTGNCFLPLAFILLLLIGIQAFLDRKLMISDTADIFHRCTIGMDIASLRV